MTKRRKRDQIRAMERLNLVMGKQGRLRTRQNTLTKRKNRRAVTEEKFVIRHKEDEAKRLDMIEKDLLENLRQT